MKRPQSDSDPQNAGLDLDRLIACPGCDAVYTAPRVEQHERAYCARCHHVLIAPRRKAGKQLIALALTVLILIVAASVFPFLAIDAGGLHHGASILQTAFAFTGALSVLSVAVLMFIVIIPMLRLVLLIYVLAPIIRDRPPARWARPAFRLSEALLPWSMAEIFALGCAVALVKIGDMAHVVFGPAAWMFAVLVVIVVVTDNLMCRYSIWKSLEN
ncbi:paraquat-inducible protein A [Roseovarius pacificus]|uniref:paraquat-inducible protein A n=1 Tax=Roseovarius pacificus TaxID=337701 RepID=UPI002595C25C|nr:paraquat-inducible protein A [Roseovarius pacificus]MDW3118176.1 paraquat-inducible protein A [Roseovarius pacificus]